MSAKTFHLSLVTPERVVLDATTRSVVLPAWDGELGVLADHAPLLVRLGAGELRVDLAEGGKQAWFVDGGFAQMVDNRLTVLTEQAVAPDELDAEAARRDLEEALASPADSEAARKTRDRAIASARARLRLAP